MSDKWEQAVVVPSGDQSAQELEETRRLIGYGIRAVFSRQQRSRERSLPVSYLQTHRGFPRKCPELYCSASIRLEPDGDCFIYHGRGQALECYAGHRFVCFRFRRLMVLSKLDLYLARLGAEKWQQVLHFPARSGYGRGLLRSLWEAPYEEVLCGSATPKEARVLARWRGFRRRFARELQPVDRQRIHERLTTCLDICSESVAGARDYAGAVEFVCAAGHRLLVSRTERGTFLSTRLMLSLSLATESL
jgi:hypothetical protein